MKGRIATPLYEFWFEIEPERSDDECWEWRGQRDKKGYGRWSIHSRPRLAHRVAWELERGPIPDGMEIDHLCRNRACVNPAHLEPVSHVENIRRSPLTVAGRNLRKTHCPQGHAYAAHGFVDPDVRGRRCGVCRQVQLRNAWTRNNQKRAEAKRIVRDGNLD